MTTPQPLSNDFSTALTVGTVITDPHPATHRADRDRLNLLLALSGTSAKHKIVNEGSGIYNVTAIQAALDAVATFGGGYVVVMGGGTYRTAAAATADLSKIKISSNTTLELIGNTTIQRGPSLGGLIVNKGDRTKGGYEQTKNITIIGGIWDGNMAEFNTQSQPMSFIHCENVTLKDLTLKNAFGSHLVEFNAVKGIRVENCRVSDMPNTADKEMIQLDYMGSSANWPDFGPYDGTACQDVLITNCYFGRSAKAIGNHGSKLGSVHKNIRINGNHFENMTEWAISLIGMENIVVAGNTVEDCGGFVFLNAEREIMNGVSITSNSIKDCKAGASHAIQVRGVEEGISGTTALSHKYSRKITIDGNTVDNVPGGIGIEVGYCKDTVVSNNVVTGCGTWGILLYRGDSTIFSGNNAKGNALITPVAAAVADMAVGHQTAGPADSAEQIIVGNIVGTLKVNYASKVLVANNVIGTYTKVAGSDAKESANIIGGTYVAGLVA